MSYWQDKVAIVTGGSAGLGLAICKALAKHGARVAVVARNGEKLAAALHSLQGDRSQQNPIQSIAISADVTSKEDIAHVVRETTEQLGSPSLLINCAGSSTRGLAIDTPVEEYQALWELNFLAALQCTQACLPSLLKNKGHVIHVGSLASKIAAKYLGAYPATKFPLAALSQQMRLELEEKGLHTLLVCPGPIKREGSTNRYEKQSDNLPEAARKPGGGVKVSGLEPDWLALQILSACEKRKAELIVPRKARLAILLSALSPRLGDWLIRKMTK